jgi:simple sugar transport system ATP-binding protein
MSMRTLTSDGGSGSPPARVPAVRMDDIVVRFGQVVANDHIHFELAAGEVHALLGENGAGKTTLMRVLAGLVHPDEGRIEVEGKVADLRSATDAARLGIGMVHQHFMLIPTLSVAENVSIGLRSAGYPFPKFRRVAEDLRELGDRYGLAVDPAAKVGGMTVGAQQRVEILKALYRGARILVLDEPTAVLTPQESAGLFEVVRGLVAEGTSVVFISHKLNEVMALSDRVTVLRAGRAVATMSASETTAHELAVLMVGRELTPKTVEARPRPNAEGVALATEGLAVADDRGLRKVDDVSLEVRAGEILGLAGVDGNGQQELCDAILGLRKVLAGEILLVGSPVTTLSLADRLRVGLALVPEDRQHTGVVLDLNVAENAVVELVGMPPYSRAGWLKFDAIDELADRLIAEYDIRCSGRKQQVRTLSGGNQQKLVLGREMFRDPVALVAMQPTRGLDVGATEQIHERLLGLREQGAGILLVSTELEEILALSDRIVVIYEGRLMGEVDRRHLDVARLGLLMAGKA